MSKHQKKKKKKKKKKWSDLSRGQQVATALASIVQIGLLSAALWDIQHRSADQVKGSKAAWTAASFINFAGPIAYFLFGRKPGGPRRASAGPAGSRRV